MGLGLHDVHHVMVPPWFDEQQGRCASLEILSSRKDLLSEEYHDALNNNR
jgi:hypothetical protein